MAEDPAENAVILIDSGNMWTICKGEHYMPDYL
jgi:hypothetical protein